MATKFYWILHHIRSALKRWLKSHPLATVGTLLLVLFLIFASRSLLHPGVVMVRRYFFIGLVLISAFWLGLWLLRKSSGKKRVLILACEAVFVIAALWIGPQTYRYLALYSRYQTLVIQDLAELPITDFERIQPQNSIYSLAHEVMTDTEAPTVPDFVRVGTDYRWTMAIEPAYPFDRIFGQVSEVISVPGVTVSPNFSRENRMAVRFPVGENMLLSRNSRSATIRTFGLWKFFQYEPTDVIYFTDQNNEWVQVVALMRWRGWLFPRPEFGGVQLIRQGESGFLATLRRMLLGSGTWIAPEEVSKHGFLQGENILPLTVSRYIAESFRFQSGFLSPLPGYHKGDIRIPDLPDDVNEQPFTCYFTLPGQSSGELYHYFALEPFDPDKQGLSTSVFIPADGKQKVYVYRHYERGSTLTGVSAIATKVRESRKNYDWSRNRAVEHRPFIREIDGRIRFFWLTTVVTAKEGEGGQRFIAGSVPDLVITDAAYNLPVWVNPLEPSAWTAELRTSMSALWGKQ